LVDVLQLGQLADIMQELEGEAAPTVAPDDFALPDDSADGIAEALEILEGLRDNATGYSEFKDAETMIAEIK